MNHPLRTLLREIFVDPVLRLLQSRRHHLDTVSALPPEGVSPNRHRPHRATHHTPRTNLNLGLRMSLIRACSRDNILASYEFRALRITGVWLGQDLDEF